MRRLLRENLNSPVAGPWVMTPWGPARSLSMRDVRAARAGRRRISRAELCVLYRDHYEAAGADPGRAIRMAIARVRRDQKASRRGH